MSGGAERAAAAPAERAADPRPGQAPERTAALLRPADVCRQLLAALDASEGRRRRRKRNTTPDALGLSIKRELLEGAVQEDPDPAAFEEWLLERCLAAGGRRGAMRAMALDVLYEWRLAEASPHFRSWLREGAPSEDAKR